MPSLSQHHSNNLVKLLLLGDAKSGKTSSLVSLVKAGYKLRILDMDNLLDPLKYQIMSHCPDKIENVEYRSLRDDYKVTAAGTVVDGKPKCWIDSLKMLNNWSYTDNLTGEVIDLGPPAIWPDDTILVIDSLSRWCDAAMEFHRSMIPVGKGGQADGRAIYGNAQDDVEKQLASLTSPNFRTNVIVICHGVYMTLDDGTTKIFPQGIGQKLSPKIPTYFPNYIRYIQKADKRTIQLTSNQMISLANGRPDAMPAELPTDTGLAEFFAILRGTGAETQVEQPAAPPKPKALTLRRA